MPKTNGRTWTIIATVVAIVVAVGGAAWAIVCYHNDDVAQVERSVDHLRDRHDGDCKELRTQARQSLEQALDKVVSGERFAAEMRAVQIQITSLQDQAEANKADLDKRLDRIEQAVRRPRRRYR